jgi:cytochrome c-type biogenesis protein CcmF
MGIAISANQGVDAQLTLEPGQTAEFAGHELTYLGDFSREETNRFVVGGSVEVRRGGDVVAVLEPRLNEYVRSNQPVATPAVDTSLRGDLYLSLTRIGGDQISLDVYWFPFVWLIWVGGLLAAAGGLYSLVVRKQTSAPVSRREADESV